MHKLYDKQYRYIQSFLMSSLAKLQRPKDSQDSINRYNSDTPATLCCLMPFDARGLTSERPGWMLPRSSGASMFDIHYTCNHTKWSIFRCCTMVKYMKYDILLGHIRKV